MRNAGIRNQHFHHHYKLVTAMCVAFFVSACVPERDNPGDPFGINPKQRDSGEDLAIDRALAEVGVDMTRADAAIDIATPDAALDQVMPDAGIDMASADAASDMGLDSAIDSTIVVVPDSTPDVSSKDGPKILRLVKGGITSVGPPFIGTSQYKLIESGFELKNRVCSATYCITGGITP